MVKSNDTKKLLGVKTRFSNEEMLLRFFAFNENLTSYNGQLSKFLNDYMEENKNIDEQAQSIKKELFQQTINFIYEIVLNRNSASSIGKTFLEGLLFGVSQNLQKLKNETPEKVRELYEDFKRLPDYSVDSLKE